MTELSRPAKLVSTIENLNDLWAVEEGRRLPDDFRRSRWVQYEIGTTDIIDTNDFEDSRDPVREITELIEAQRGYELNAKVISAADQILGATVQIR